MNAMPKVGRKTKQRSTRGSSQRMLQDQSTNTYTCHPQAMEKRFPRARYPHNTTTQRLTVSLVGARMHWTAQARYGGPLEVG